MWAMARKNCAIMIIILLGCCSLATAEFEKGTKESTWLEKLRSLRPLESSRRDFETSFQNLKVIWTSDSESDSKDWGRIIEYQTEEGKLEIFLSTGKCADFKGDALWDVEPDVVVSSTFEPKKSISLKELEFDWKKFYRYRESDNAYYQYKSAELGIEFTALENRLTQIEFIPRRDQAALDCDKINAESK